MRVEYTLAFEEFREAYRTPRRGSARLPSGPLLLATAAAAALAALLTGTGWTMAAVLLVLGVLRTGQGLVVEACVRHVWRSMPYAARPGAVECTDEGVTLSDTVGTSTVAWRAIRGLDETAHVFRLYLSRSLFVVIPKRALGGPAGERAFREAVSRALARAGGGP